MNISRSQALHTTVMRRGKEHNSALVSVGMIDVNIPQHPVVLHGMMTRSSRRLTTTLQEFRWPLSRTGWVQFVPLAVCLWDCIGGILRCVVGFVCVCVCVKERERESVCVCVCVCARACV